jgi:hypothetical protein
MKIELVYVCGVPSAVPTPTGIATEGDDYFYDSKNAMESVGGRHLLGSGGTGRDRQTSSLPFEISVSSGRQWSQLTVPGGFPGTWGDQGKNWQSL